MNEKEKVLTNNAQEYFSSAERDFKENKNNSSVVMYFKCLIALVDLYILKKTGETPSSHSNRFKILRTNYPKIYDLVDKDFPFYQDSYVQTMSKELAEVIKISRSKLRSIFKLQLPTTSIGVKPRSIKLS